MSAARRLRIAPTAAEVLADEISELAAQIDRRLANRPGTAEQAIYFWHGPPGWQGVDLLTRLHADAVALLAQIVNHPDTKEGHQ